MSANPQHIERDYATNKIIIPEKPDLKKEILAKVGNRLDGLVVFHHYIVCAKFIHEKRGTVIMSDLSKAQARYQTKVGLVLKIGPNAFEDDGNNQFHGTEVRVGDWIFFRHADPWDFDLVLPDGVRSIEMTMVEDAAVRGRLAAPDLIY